MSRGGAHRNGEEAVAAENGTHALCLFVFGGGGEKGEEWSREGKASLGLLFIAGGGMGESVGQLGVNVAWGSGSEVRGQAVERRRRDGLTRAQERGRPCGMGATR